MKKISLILLLASSILSFSQQNDQNLIDSSKQNELKINGLYLVIGSFELTYERALNEESALGISAFLPFDEDIKDDINYYISPYYRFYFGKKYASGFFVEGFGMLNSVKEEEEVVLSPPDLVGFDEVNTTDFALGIGLGGKWVTNRGFLAELNFGVGRNLFNSSDSDNEFVGKVGISVGFRF